MAGHGGFVASLADHETNEFFADIEIPGFTEPEWKLDAALAALARGHRVLPCDGKRPLLRRGYLGASSSAADVYEWWTHSYPAADVGVVVSTDEIVLDVDPRNGGERSLARLEAELGPLPATFTVLTGGTDGGRHLYFRFPDDVPVRKGKVEGIDVRTSTGYLIAAGSRHQESGSYYRVDEITAELEPAVLPIEWLRAIYDPEPFGVSSSSGETTRIPSAAPVGEFEPLPVTGALSPEGLAMIRTGVKTYGDTSSSGVLWSCLWFCSWAGFSEAAVLTLAADPANPGLHGEYVTRGRTHVKAQYRYVGALRVKRGDVEGGERRDTAVTAELAATLDHLVTERTFRGVVGSYAVLALRYAIGKVRSTPEITLSLREVETAIGADHRKTATRVIDYLIRLGLLLPAEVTRYGRRYSLGPALLAPAPPNPQTPPHDVPGDELRMAVGHEAFSLDPVGARIVDALPGTPAEVSSRTGIPSSTVYRHLRTLRIEAAVDRENGVYSLAVDLDVLARWRGHEGAAARRAKRHTLERRLHRDAVAEWHDRMKAEAVSTDDSGTETVEDGVVIDTATGEILGSAGKAPVLLPAAVSDFGTVLVVFPPSRTRRRGQPILERATA